MPKRTESPALFAEKLNLRYSKLHESYERLFWTSYMGDHGMDERMNQAQIARDAFRSDARLRDTVRSLLAQKTTKGKARESLLEWERFFGLYQTPQSALAIRKKVADLESQVLKRRSDAKQGYIDPASRKFVAASENKMRTMMSTDPDEAVRKACFNALEKLPLPNLGLYIQIIRARNEYARTLGYEDFYAYRLAVDDGMTKKELFGLFEAIYDKTKFGFDQIRELEKSMPGLRKPWNMGYMMTGDFTKEEDPYFGFEEALMYWGRSFAALGVDFAGGTVTLDLLDRKGKYNNGFCHWPKIVRYEGKERIPGQSNFTCTAILGQVGSGIQGLETLFHEGGHAAHLLNTDQRETCLNHEYPPQSAAWAEVQSMFMDTISSSVEWKARYAKSREGARYPLDLFERKARKLHPMRPLGFMHMFLVAYFEKEIYEAKSLTKQKVIEIARKAFKKYSDKSEDSIRVLITPHIYSWESSANYHGYALAELGVCQWRQYFFEKYGYIVDNPAVGKEMKKVWKQGSKHTAKEFIALATGKKLSPDAYIHYATKTLNTVLSDAAQRIKRLESVPIFKKPIKLGGKIYLVHGKKKIADSSNGFEAMDRKYRNWLETMKAKRE